MAATPDFSIESERRKSFKYWEVTFVSPDELAFAGFYYYPLNYDVCGHSMSFIDDRVKCFCCGIELGHWREGDIPMVEHEKFSPSCQFLNDVKRQYIGEKVTNLCQNIKNFFRHINF